VTGSRATTNPCRLLAGLRAEARKAGSWPTFLRDFGHEYKHGLSWHVTSRRAFQIDPTTGPRNVSSLADTSAPTVGALQVTSDLAFWLDHDESRPWVARIDLSRVPRRAYWQVQRGFGHEFWVEPTTGARVAEVLSRADALRVDAAYAACLPQTEDALRAFYRATVRRTR
jgi:hypothetical protein